MASPPGYRSANRSPPPTTINSTRTGSSPQAYQGRLSPLTSPEFRPRFATSVFRSLLDTTVSSTAISGNSGKRKSRLFLILLASLIALVFCKACSTTQCRSIFQDILPIRPFISSQQIDGRHGLSILSSWSHQHGLRLSRVATFNLDNRTSLRSFAYPYELLPVPVTAVPEHLKWTDAYPEWVNQSLPSSCPEIPQPETPSWLGDVDAIVAYVPCDKPSDMLAKDIRWMHQMLSLAEMVMKLDKPWLPLLLLSPCRPPPNLFHCSRLVRNEGPVWLFNVSAADVAPRIQPLGSCGMAQPIKGDPPAIGTVAYATVLHTTESYVCGAMVLAHSIRRSGSQHDMVVLVSPEISNRSRDALREAGWKVKEIERIRNPFARKSTYNEWNYSKLRLWQLTEYSSVIFVDADLLVLRNLDHLFAFPDLSARGNDQTDFNSGLMLIRPSQCTFRELLANAHTIRSPNGGDQGYLNNYFTWWHRLPDSVNILKHVWATEETKRAQELEMKNRWFSEEPAEIHTIHYLGRKPWQCYRDFDCTWLYPLDHAYANEAAHQRWWKMHDSMPENLHQYCGLRNLHKAEIEFRMRKLKAQGAPPAFWDFEVKDPRKEECMPDQISCDWMDYLNHWKDEET
ncbi:hypothetical protein CLOM_g21524 [Closterium sp. NIES-68]|nr:hypothetical protein CLOM_g21524 [Closterium sp. NIES-68]GJP69863.1 hypothetical protein CLOP_g869 [Closterium sp. NIES-67]